MRLPFFHNRRQEILVEPFPDEQRDWLQANVAQYRLLPPAEKSRLEGDLRIFQAEKFWEGGQDFVVTDEMKVTISAFACILTLGFEKSDYYPNVETIIVYPAGYRAPASGGTFGAVVEQTYHDLLGEAYDSGPVILSWSDALRGGANGGDGHNVVLHEFAHKLDFRYGRADGVPSLQTQEQADRWSDVMSREYAGLVDDVRHYRSTFLDEYGATNAAEFFAVATESFFEKPVQMRRKLPELYEVLRDFYRQDWAERMEKSRA